MVEVLGRSVEQAAINRFVAGVRDGPRGGPRGLAIEGEAGIGKSTLWSAALEAVRATGPDRPATLVLEARPASPDVRLSFSGLVDLFEPVADRVLAALPPPQRTALEIALYRAPATETTESGLIGVAVLNGLRLLTRDQPVVLAIDDLQWLDEASSTALQHAVRRLRTEAIGTLTAQRTSPDVEPAADLVSLLADPESIERLHLGALPLGAVHHLIRTRLDVSLPRPTLVRLHADSGGNPLYALELARSLVHARTSLVAGASAPDFTIARDDPPSPLRDLLRRRLASQPEATRAVLLAIALDGAASPERLAGVTGLSTADVRDRLEPARRDGLLEPAVSDLRIGHPLLAAVLVETAGDDERRDLHRRLAGMAEEPEARARHLAAAADTPDPTVASALVEAAEQALSRGATGASAELLDLALAHWPTDDAAGRRRLRVKRAERIFLAGDTARAHAELAALDHELAVAGSDEADARVDAAILLATVIIYDGDSRDAARVLEDTLPAVADPASRGRIHARLTWIYEHDLLAAAEHGKRAVELLDPAREPGEYSFALMNLASTELALGRGANHDAILRGHELQERGRGWDFSSLPANWAKWFDQFDRSRELNLVYVDRARQSGDESSVAQLLMYLVELETWTGNLDRAEQLATEAIEAAEQTGQPSYLSSALARRALVEAALGRLDPARADARRATELAVELGSSLLEGLGLATLGLIELSAGALDAAADALDRALAVIDATGMIEQPMFRFHADQIEAHIRLGHLDVAERLLDRHRERLRAAPRPWLVLTEARCSALLMAARGDLPAAIASADAALAAAPALDWPLEVGRTWLVAGEVKRRAGQRKAAATAVGEALRIFASVRAATWLGRAEREAAALGFHPDDDPRALTPAEDRVARLAASGLTNREIAARLVVSPKTVEASLARSYQKLGIRRRAELGTRLGSPDPVARGGG